MGLIPFAKNKDTFEPREICRQIIDLIRLNVPSFFANGAKWAVFLLSLFYREIHSEEFYPEPSPRPMRLISRHIEPNGIGYHQGYTTLESFLPLIGQIKTAWLPFADFRVHVFNDGNPALNAGFGARYRGSYIWGINGYYDYRKTPHQHYNQASIGLEALSRNWDFRMNGYLPVGNKLRKWKEDEGHFSCKKEYALKGVNFEVGYHENMFPDMPLYFAAGPYYLTAKGEAAWGGEGRVALGLFTYARVEANISYDHLFRWIAQGQISLIIPFGSRGFWHRKQGAYNKEILIEHREIQRVSRNEIIPVNTMHSCQ